MRRFQESFDAFQTLIERKWNGTLQNCSIATSYGRNGQGLKNYNSGVPPYLTLDAQQNWICGFAYNRAVGQVGVSTLLAYKDSTTTQVDLRLGATGHLYVTRGGATQIGPTSSYVMPIASWVYIEFQAFIHDTAGYFEVRVNGVNVCSATAVDTKQTANAWADVVGFGTPGGSDYFYVDDFYLNDAQGTDHNSFDGDQKILCFVANTNGSQNGWTPSTGSDHYAVIDEKPPNDDTDYLYSSTVNDIFSCAFEDISIVGSVGPVQVCALIRKDDAGSRTVALVTRSGGVNYFSAGAGVGNSYLYYKAVYEKDPNTGANWTEAGFNAAEFGAKVIA